jgi:HK97 family phage major capsid protein
MGNLATATTALDAASKVIAFGDFSKFIIRDVQDFVIHRADELFLERGVIGFIGMARHGSELVVASTVYPPVKSMPYTRSS